MFARVLLPFPVTSATHCPLTQRRLESAIFDRRLAICVGVAMAGYDTLSCVFGLACLGGLKATQGDNDCAQDCFAPSFVNRSESQPRGTASGAPLGPPSNRTHFMILCNRQMALALTAHLGGNRAEFLTIEPKLPSQRASTLTRGIGHISPRIFKARFRPGTRRLLGYQSRRGWLQTHLAGYQGPPWGGPSPACSTHLARKVAESRNEPTIPFRINEACKIATAQTAQNRSNQPLFCLFWSRKSRVGRRESTKPPGPATENRQPSKDTQAVGRIPLGPARTPALPAARVIWPARCRRHQPRTGACLSKTGNRLSTVIVRPSTFDSRLWTVDRELSTAILRS